MATKQKRKPNMVMLQKRRKITVTVLMTVSNRRDDEDITMNSEINNDLRHILTNVSIMPTTMIMM
jgi:hypothetical protein